MVQHLSNREPSPQCCRGLGALEVIPFRGPSNGGTVDEELHTTFRGRGDVGCKRSDLHELRLSGAIVGCARLEERDAERRYDRRRLGRRSRLARRRSRLAWRSRLARWLLLGRSRLGARWRRCCCRCTRRRCGGRTTCGLRPAGRLCPSAAWILRASAGLRSAAGDPAAEVTQRSSRVRTCRRPHGAYISIS
jgi:hypothetical protein